MTISTTVLTFDIGKQYCLLSVSFNRILTLVFETLGINILLYVKHEENICDISDDLEN